MPMSASAPEDTWSFAANFNWSNSELVQSGASEALIVDAETKELELSLTRKLSDRWSLSLHLPYRDIDGGSLDDFIDNWHDVFGLPEGARPELGENRLWVRYARDGTTLLNTNEPQDGFGDASLTLAYALLARPSSAISAGISIKAPTGENHWYHSSGATDVSIVLAAEHAFSERWSIRGQGAVSWLGEGDLLPQYQRDIVWSGHTALAWRATRRLELLAQLDAHTRVFDSDLDFFEEALVLSLGGAIHLSQGWSIRLGVSEDIAVEQSPDVVFVLSIGRRGRRDDV